LPEKVSSWVLGALPAPNAAACGVSRPDIASRSAEIRIRGIVKISVTQHLGSGEARPGNLDLGIFDERGAGFEGPGFRGWSQARYCQQER